MIPPWLGKILCTAERLEQTTAIKTRRIAPAIFNILIYRHCFAAGATLDIGAGQKSAPIYITNRRTKLDNGRSDERINGWSNNRVVG